MTNPLDRQTQSGPIQGYADDAKRVWAWKSIPFAKPPVGDLRWHAPQDPEPWGEVQAAVDECPWALQLEGTPGWLSLPNPVGGEDCLYLNVYRPQSDEQDLPVYFWIHGGANTSGEADAYDMENLAREANLVVVVVQYRMSVLGYFTHPALRETLDPAAASGNLGALDQIKALVWVRDNIANFGGDAGNVTIAGESAGGHNVMAMLTSPLAEGLFHKAVMQSGGMVSQSVATTDEIAKMTVNHALIMQGLAADVDAAAVLQAGMDGADLRDFLYGLSAADLMTAHAGGPGQTAVPIGNLIEDGHVIPGPLFSVIESGNYHKVPFMAGSNTHESGSINTLLPGLYDLTENARTTSQTDEMGQAFSAGLSPKMPDYYKLLEVVAGSKTLDEVLPTDADKLGWTVSRDLNSRFWRAFMVDELVRRMRLHQDDLYVYLFEWGDESVRPDVAGFVYGAAHALEIPFMHGNATDDALLDANELLIYAGMTDANLPGRQALTEAMVHYLSAFVRTGDPNGDGRLPMWGAWTNDGNRDKILRVGASLDQAQIRMDSEELSVASVRAEVLALDPAVLGHVKVVLGAMAPYWEMEFGVKG